MVLLLWLAIHIDIVITIVIIIVITITIAAYVYYSKSMAAPSEASPAANSVELAATRAFTSVTELNIVIY